MRRGFLFLDQEMNTVLVTVGSKEMDDLCDYFKFSSARHRVKSHRTLKELDKDIRAYLKNTYLEADELEDELEKSVKDD